MQLQDIHLVIAQHEDQ